jgi:hypothetical protein
VRTGSSGSSGSYASTHAWENCAETWAHYLHMPDALETVAACGLALRPHRPDEPSLKTAAKSSPRASFDHMIDCWLPLTYVLNNLNRSLGYSTTILLFFPHR